MKRKLALGSQEFSEVIGNNCIYVDKTEKIYELVTGGKYYFMSRPRRFGKSLLANTLKELFLGSKKLFKGLWIYDKWDWETTYPVIKLSFSLMDYEKLGLETAINIELDEIAANNNLVLVSNTNGNKFRELIKKISTKGQVAIIIDEYDKPIIDYIAECINVDKIENCQADKNRKILKNFYSVLKDLDSYIKFFFITGVSKFSQVSIFSDLNNLTDITIDNRFSQILGWTREELEKYFPDYIKSVAQEYKDVYQDIMPEIKKWYNGYSWDGKTRLFNPVSVMNFFQKRTFGNYWFRTGTPTMLMDIIRTRNITPFDIENVYISTEILDKYDFKNINFKSLLFQTGYLTIKNYDDIYDEITLDYPNQEVAKSFSAHILSAITSDKLDDTDNLIHKMRRSFLSNEIDDFFDNLNILFENIPNLIVHKTEKYFHSLFYLVVKILGFYIEAEILTLKSRIDAVIKTKTNIYIIEFKINQSAQKAIQQIKDKNYALKYADDTRPISLIGINFDTEKKIIAEWKIEN